MTDDYKLVTDEETFQELLDDLQLNNTFEFVALDSESYPSMVIANDRNVLLGLSPKLNDLRLLQIGICDDCEDDSPDILWYPEMENFRNYVIDLRNFARKQLHKLWVLLNKKTLVMHNAKFDLAMLNHHYGFYPEKIFCTLVTSQTLGHATGSTHVGNMSRSLAALVSDWLSLPEEPIVMSKKERLSDWSREHLSESQLDYAAKDTKYLIPICMLIRKLAKKLDMEFDLDLENKVLPAVVRMEQNGLVLDTGLYDRICALATAEIPRLQCEVFNILDIPLQKVSRLGGKKAEYVVTDTKVFNSPVRLKKVLQDAGIKVDNLQAATLKALVDTLKGNSSEDELSEETLSDLLSDKAGSMPRETKLELIEKIMRIKVLQKLVDNQYSRFVNPKTGCIHPKFNQSRAQTGRFACNNPNLQSVSKGSIYDPEEHTEYYLREIFKPKGQWVTEGSVTYWEGHIMGARDIDRQELVVAAYASGDKTLKTALDLGEDLHTTHALLAWPELTAEQVRDPMEKLGGKKPRDQAKVIIYGLLYGQDPLIMAANMGLSESEGAAFYDKLRERYPDLFKWLDEISEFGQKYHWVTLTKNGLSRRRRFLGGNAHGASDKGTLGRLAKNTPIQGLSAIMAKMMLVECDDYIQDNGIQDVVFINGQIHDEFIFSTPGRVYFACSIKDYHEAKAYSGDKEPKRSKYETFVEEVWPVTLKSGEILENPFDKMGELMSAAGNRCVEHKMEIGTGLAPGPYWVKD